MPIIRSDKGESEALLQSSKLMLVSARTAPKSKGLDNILTAVVSGKEKEALTEEMDKIGDERKLKGFKRDAQNLKNSETSVLIGIRGTLSPGLNCGACGYATCSEFDKAEKKRV